MRTHTSSVARLIDEKKKKMHTCDQKEKGLMCTADIFCSKLSYYEKDKKHLKQDLYRG